MKSKTILSARIIIPQNMKPLPSSEEIKVAYLLINYFHKDVEFIEKCNIKTPDFRVDKVEWELKTPRGNGAKTIENILRIGSKQSRNIILNLNYTKMPYQKVLANVNKFLKFNSCHIDKVLIVSRLGNIDIIEKM